MRLIIEITYHRIVRSADFLWNDEAGDDDGIRRRRRGMEKGGTLELEAARST